MHSSNWLAKSLLMYFNSVQLPRSVICLLILVSNLVWRPFSFDLSCLLLWSWNNGGNSSVYSVWMSAFLLGGLSAILSCRKKKNIHTQQMLKVKKLTIDQLTAKPMSNKYLGLNNLGLIDNFIFWKMFVFVEEVYWCWSDSASSNGWASWRSYGSAWTCRTNSSSCWAWKFSRRWSASTIPSRILLCWFSSCRGRSTWMAWRSNNWLPRWARMTARCRWALAMAARNRSWCSWFSWRCSTALSCRCWRSSLCLCCLSSCRAAWMARLILLLCLRGSVKNELLARETRQLLLKITLMDTDATTQMRLMPSVRHTCSANGHWLSECLKRCFKRCIEFTMQRVDAPKCTGQFHRQI